jgi:hypothetical protein
MDVEQASLLRLTIFLPEASEPREVVSVNHSDVIQCEAVTIDAAQSSCWHCTTVR